MGSAERAIEKFNEAYRKPGDVSTEAEARSTSGSSASPGSWEKLAAPRSAGGPRSGTRRRDGRTRPRGTSGRSLAGARTRRNPVGAARSSRRSTRITPTTWSGSGTKTLTRTLTRTTMLTRMTKRRRTSDGDGESRSFGQDEGGVGQRQRGAGSDPRRAG